MTYVSKFDPHLFRIQGSGNYFAGYPEMPWSTFFQTPGEQGTVTSPKTQFPKGQWMIDLLQMDSNAKPDLQSL